ncbi:MAG: class I SAM-dependent methyltransferase [Alphaproteobacteria bacterium]|nr:class I SAM-dependent methyltransferase [Alphaproteobacteria bacterium]
MSLDSQGNTDILGSGRPGRRRGLVAPLLRRLLSGIDAGRLTVVTPSGQRIEHRALQDGPEALLVLHSWRALRRVIIGGDVGFAEAYMAGEWTTPDLSSLIAVVAKNCDYLERAILGWVPLRAFNRLLHLRNRNSKAGSRRNIAFHYDLGDDFYRLWLDRSMTYSSALFDDPAQSLEEAQLVKQARIMELLQLEGGERVLEIGCGWGSLATRLAAGGARVTALTLSQRQFSHTQALAATHGVAPSVETRLEDYRDSTGTFDRIVSIEMLEAVGEQYWPVYFATLRERLNAGGRAVLQVITIAEERFDNYRRGVDFIQRYIFPGGLLPTKDLITHHASQAGLTPVSTIPFGASYAATLAEWRQRFLAAWPEIEQLGFPPSFRRLWQYYLAYCEAGFRTGLLDVAFYVLTG